MGAFASKPIHDSNTYALGGRNVKITVIGELQSVVKHGDVVRVEFTSANKPTPALVKYLNGSKFISDLNNNIMHRDAGAAAEYSLPVAHHTLQHITWNALAGVRISGTKVGFHVALRGKGEHTLADACAFMAGCMAWHFKSGSIPVLAGKHMSETDAMEVVAVSFKLDRHA
jgi:hypothetical protein